MTVIPFARPTTHTRTQQLALADSARLRRYRDALAFYEGQHYARPRRGRSALVANYARTIVDKGVSFLLGRGVSFAVERRPAGPFQGQHRGDEASVDAAPPFAVREGAPVGLGPEGPAGGLGPAAAETLLYQVYEDNDLDQVDLACATNAAVLGDGIYKVFWDAAAGRIRVVSVDPFTFFAAWGADDLATLQRVEVAYALTAADAAMRYAAPVQAEAGPPSAPADGSILARIANATARRLPRRIGVEPAGAGGSAGGAVSGGGLVEVVETWTAATFRLEVGGRVVREGPNPYGVIPFVHVPNLPGPNECWGRSDLADVMPLNRELDERMSDQADVIRYHADPPVVFRGVEDHDAITVGPGSVWDIPRDADVRLLEWQGQPVAVQEHINQVLRALYETSETPRTAFGDSGRLLSGVALETELRPLIQKTLRKRIVWGAALRRRARLTWQVAEGVGLAPPGAFAGLRPRIVWPSMMPQDDVQDVRNNVALVAAGLRSRQTALDALGAESPEVELARIAGERPAPAPP